MNIVIKELQKCEVKEMWEINRIRRENMKQVNIREMYKWEWRKGVEMWKKIKYLKQSKWCLRDKGANRRERYKSVLEEMAYSLSIMKNKWNE